MLFNIANIPAVTTELDEFEKNNREKEIEIITEEKGELNVKKMSDFLPYGFKIQGN